MKSLAEIEAKANELISKIHYVTYKGVKTPVSLSQVGYKFAFDNAKRTFGCCQTAPTLMIFLSKPNCLNNMDNDETIIDTILHEIAHGITHLLYPKASHHGLEWQNIAKEIGCNGNRCADGTTLNMVKGYTYTCPVCGRQHQFYKRLKVARACAPCCNKYNNGKWSNAFRLVLQS